MGSVRTRLLPRFPVLLAVALLIIAPLVAIPTAASAGPQSRIIGGQPTSTEEFPFAVALLDMTGRQFCGGTLVAADKVVTAAHCAAAGSVYTIRAAVGRTDLRTSAGEVVGLRDIWIHPRFRTVRKGYDVAVLTLSRSVSERPARLPGDNDLYASGTTATILGWGTTQEGSTHTSDVLRRAEVPIVSDAACARSYDAYRSRLMVCAGHEEGGVDTCQGDSGGPLVVDGVLIGTTSFGTGCARPSMYGVYSRVITYVSDLREQIHS